MTADTGKPLTEQARAAVWRELVTLGTTARVARQLAQSDQAYTTASLLSDIAAMEAILRRLRQAVDDRPVCPKCGTAGCLEDKAADW